MTELFEDNGFISREGWYRRIEALRPVKELMDSEDKIASEVLRLAQEAVKERIEGKDSIGICFSGGLDSSLIAAICKKNNANFTCYTVGFQDGNMEIPEDITHAANVAKFLRLSDDEFKSKIFNLKEAEEIIKKTAKILKNIPEHPDINRNVNIGVAGVEVAAYSISKKERHFFSGIGSEEIYAGYERHKNTPTNDECYNGLLKMYNRDLLRDATVAEALKFGFLAPFLDEKLVKYSLAIPIKFKINDSGNKMILRKAALPLLERYSERPKKAAQYGSSFDKAIVRLAKKAGHETRLEYIKSI